MNPLDAARQYLEAWNARDAVAIASCFDSGGTYTDPAAGTIPGAGVGSYAQGLWGAFPDLAFEVVSLVATECRRQAASFRFRASMSSMSVPMASVPSRVTSIPGLSRNNSDCR
ncbi:MAG: hypothetical protein RLZZ200_805 [Pseudomonadota bacterium]